jgi:hypothetical protein
MKDKPEARATRELQPLSNQTPGGMFVCLAELLPHMIQFQKKRKMLI